MKKERIFVVGNKEDVDIIRRYTSFINLSFKVKAERINFAFLERTAKMIKKCDKVVFVTEKNNFNDMTKVLFGIAKEGGKMIEWI